MREALARLKEALRLRSAAGSSKPVDVERFLSTALTHVATVSVSPSGGVTLWDAIDLPGTSVWWPWQRLAGGVLCVGDLAAIQCLSRLRDGEGVLLNEQRAMTYVLRLIAATEWQEQVLAEANEQQTSSWGGLSAREADCLRLSAEGLTAREAANEIGLTAQTVSNYLSAAYRKLGVHSRGAAMRDALQLAIVSRA